MCVVFFVVNKPKLTVTITSRKERETPNAITKKEHHSYNLTLSPSLALSCSNSLALSPSLTCRVSLSMLCLRCKANF